MSPVGRPDEMHDGRPMRGYRGKPDPLGPVGEWDCPGCGGKNTSRFEEGCVHCGAGKPGEMKKKVEEAPRSVVEAPQREMGHIPVPAAVASRGVPLEPSSPLVVYRLIEYIFSSPSHMAETLQRSLVGKITMPVGTTITATIVDDVSVRQKDLLGLAARQPGIWVAQMDQNRLMYVPPPGQGGRPHFVTGISPAPDMRRQDDLAEIFNEAAARREAVADTPDPALTPTDRDRETAGTLQTLLGYKGAYTLVLALQMFAEQVEASPLNGEMHYNRADCLQLAAALNDLIPAEWGQGEAPVEEAPAETLKDA